MRVRFKEKLRSLTNGGQLQTDLILVLVTAFISLYIWSFFGLRLTLQFSELGFNDQANYITTARNLSERGRLDSSVIYIGALTQNYTKNTLYMPGYPFILAVFYRILGYGTKQSLLPSLLAFVVGTELTFLIARENFGRKAAWFTTMLFLIFPLYLLYSFSVMTEMVFLAASLVAFYVFTRLKPGQRWIVGPILVALVFLIREIGALLIVLMAFYMLLPDWRQSWKETLGFCITTSVLLLLVYVSPLSSGRISLFYSFMDRPLYDDINTQPVVLTFPGLVRLFHNNAGRNWHKLSLLSSMEIFTYATMILGILLLVFWASLKRKLTGLVVSVPIFFIASLGLTFFLYETAAFRGIRSLIFVSPFALIGLGTGLAMLAERLLGKLEQVFWTVVFSLALIFVSQFQQLATGIISPDVYEYERSSIRFIEKLQNNNQKVLVAPHELAIPYVAAYYPVRYAFLPRSRPAFELLSKRFEIGIVIYPARGLGPANLSTQDLLDLGLILQSKIRFENEDYLIFKPQGQTKP